MDKSTEAGQNAGFSRPRFRLCWMRPLSRESEAQRIQPNYLRFQHTTATNTWLCATGYREYEVSRRRKAHQSTPSDTHHVTGATQQHPRKLYSLPSSPKNNARQGRILMKMGAVKRNTRDAAVWGWTLAHLASDHSVTRPRPRPLFGCWMVCLGRPEPISPVLRTQGCIHVRENGSGYIGALW